MAPVPHTLHWCHILTSTCFIPVLGSYDKWPLFTEQIAAEDYPQGTYPLSRLIQQLDDTINILGLVMQKQPLPYSMYCQYQRFGKWACQHIASKCICLIPCPSVRFADHTTPNLQGFTTPTKMPAISTMILTELQEHGLQAKSSYFRLISNSLTT